MDEYIVYVQTDESERIVSVNSSAFVSADWGTEIDRGTGDKYHHAQNHYFNGGLYTADGISRYKMEDGKPVKRTEEEIQSDRDSLPPISGGDDDERISALESEVSALQESIRKGLAM